jgi:CHRD domain
MRRTVLAAAILVGAATVVPATYANAQDFHAKFSGFNEIGGLGAGETGAIFSQGQATLKLKLNTKLQTLNWTLTYSGLGAPVTQAHIHFGKVHVAGGIMVFFCSNLPNPPAGTQLCPASGTISGMFTGGSVIGPTAQNITPGDFNALAQALLSKTAYGNIHTTAFPAGEIRGEIRRDDDEDQHEDHHDE